jgi:hypothetical protein
MGDTAGDGLTRLTSYSHLYSDTTSVTPSLEKVTECIPYVC